jgi:molybdenum cofactor guanylyltransferase
MKIAMSCISGLILAGGRGSRMGGVDKGLQDYRGLPLARHALLRLAPQVGKVMLNANRNLATYRKMGIPVWPDEVEDFPGPLAGMMAGLAHCETPYMVTVPCDTPNFPLELVERLASALAEGGAEMAVACTRGTDKLLTQPVFCLMNISLAERLRAFVARGERKTGLWAHESRAARVVFDDEAAFFNINTLGELEQSQRPA